ncbi:ectonucleotide pyrophosphatase/phosphodiesterase [Sphingomonas kyeonggiensis]|uniref:Putative AlkP superfamily pyrophosphatase or phosphodiesterase n=1 Tax=Sphingomonas kyeonggiensis TaxID=1268553 RepID=A0A7W6NWP6_9SPHN|nr:ectonucleotide pyrophosphatase/phosphodiesterase [Sphingomonas kyeonggiensis]MBB4098453.1 putative AlkP superfamily pyrophosphatase or phosphodiesterase [Sphingomonas kyeonggiensis]
MRWYSKIAAAALAAVLQACATAPVAAPPPAAAPAPVAEQRAPVTILVSIDGFRSDYLQRGVTPNLSRLAASGVTAPMHPSFPSKTFPNHWTLVTGMYPDHHGITANKMEDAARPKEVFTMQSDDPFWWNEADPIWVDAEKAGIRTGTEFWPGSNVAIGGRKADKWPYEIAGGTRPSDWAQFNQVITGEQRVNALIDWLRRPAATRPKFLTLYFDTVDSAGHMYGPDDRRTTDAAADVDKLVGQLVDGLAGLGQPANLVIVADHGMAATSGERTVVATTGLAPEDYHLVEAGPYLSLTPAPGKEARVEKVLLGKHDHYECWRKSEIPARFHYGTNARIPAILCLAETGWSVGDKPGKAGESGGNHGFDNLSPEMTALFIAYGPAFKQAVLPAFTNVDVYPLLRDLIGLPAKPGVDGTDAPFRDVLAR